MYKNVGSLVVFWMIFCSCVFGLLVLYTMILRRVSINSQMSIYSLSESIDEVELDERLEAERFINDVYKELPWVMLPSKWYAKKGSKKAVSHINKLLIGLVGKCFL